MLCVCVFMKDCAMCIVVGWIMLRGNVSVWQVDLHCSNTTLSASDVFLCDRLCYTLCYGVVVSFYGSAVCLEQYVLLAWGSVWNLLQKWHIINKNSTSNTYSACEGLSLWPYKQQWSCTHKNTHPHLVLSIWDGLFFIMDLPTGHKPET